MRLYKYLKAFANLTQVEVVKLYEENRIKVNNEIVSFSHELKENDVVTLDNNVVSKLPFRYYLYYKPVGIISDLNGKDSSYSNHINIPYKLMPAGRLDKNSEGLMILSNDGKFINDISLNKEKEYIVSLEKEVTDDFLLNVCKSIEIKGKETLPMVVKKIDNYTINMTLKDGKYHQIRKAVSLQNNKVINLKRIRISSYSLNNMMPGDIIEIKK